MALFGSSALTIRNTNLTKQYVPAFLYTEGKRRRAEANFPGADIILRQIKEKPAKKRVGLVSKGPPARGVFIQGGGGGGVKML